MDVLNRQQAADRREVGMARAEDHANAVEQNWSEKAMSHLEVFCEIARLQGLRFIVEDVRAFATDRGLETPSERAWGAVIRRAAKAGMIRKCGYAPAKSSNLSPKCLWEVV